MSNTLRILLVDDNPDDRTLISHALHREFPDIHIEQIRDAATLAEALQHHAFDLVITDYQLRWTDGLAVLCAVKRRYANCPVIMFTGTGSEEIAVEAMKAGLDDYVLKSPKHFARLPAAVRSALERAQERRAAREAEERYRAAVEQASEGIFVVDVDTRGYLEANAAYQHLVGYTLEELRDLTLYDVVAHDREGIDRHIQRMLDERQHVIGERQHRRKDGSLVDLEVSAHLISFGGRDALCVTTRDITERKLTEKERREQQRYLALLNDITRAAIETPDFQAVLQTLADRLGKLIGADGCYVTLWDEEQQRAIPAAAYGPLREMYPTIRTRPGEVTMTESVLRAGRALVAEDVFNSPYLSRRIAAMFPARSLLGLPLIAGDQRLGAALIAFNEPHQFTPEEIARGEQAAGQIALAVAKARAFEAARHRAREAETLRLAGAVVAATLRQEEAIQRILEQLKQVVPYDSASVQLLRQGYLEIVGGRGWADLAAVIGLRFPVPGDNPNTKVIEERRPYILADAPATHAPFREEPHSHIRSWLGVPLIVHDQVIGMLAVDSAQPDHFTADHARLAAAFANQVAIALENARLFEAEQRQREAAAALLEITHVAGSSLEPTQVLKHIAQLTAGACQADRCTIFLLDNAEEYLQPVMSQFADGHVDLELWQIFKTTTADQVDVVPMFRDAIRERRPMLLDDPTRTDLVPRKWTQPFGIQKLLVVPLISQDRAIGVMALDHTDASREFTPEQIELALTIGGRVAASIVNAQLHAEVQERAITDVLTGLYNRRGFFELGRREVERALRFGRPLAAIMFDLDHFKRVNDAYGHPVGDQVLAGLAEHCRQELREVDLLGRYGGEEFAVLVPESHLATARPVAERLRRRVEQTAIATDHGPVAITISLGVAELEGCADLEALLERADQALYAAKRAGRNRVCVSGSRDTLNA